MRADAAVTGVRQLLRTVKRIAGMPDYPAYVEHRLRCHPGEPILDERAFYDEYIRTRYGSPGARCC